jgi:tetratricopeptide (TPR) repeat protein
MTGFNFKNISNSTSLIIIIFCCFVLYGNTLKNDYALDDAIVITQNEFTKQGIQGIPSILSTDSFVGFFGKDKKLVAGGRYRPLSLVSFALEYHFFGKNPFISHLLNIIFYAILVFLIYWVISNLLSNFLKELQKIIALVTAFIFMLHPIHTEVVSNIKGRDEIFSLLFSLLSFGATMYYVRKTNWAWICGAMVFMFLALLSKENALAFVLIIPFGLYYFQHVSLPKAGKIFIFLIIPAIIFIFIRQRILGEFSASEANELMNNPFLGASSEQKLATIFYTWAIYLKLLLFPHPLTYDYYPYHIGLVGFSNLLVWITLIVLAGLSVFVFKNIRTRNIYSFSIIGFAVSFIMVSNLIFPVGTFMNERFVFMPSLFWSMALSAASISLIYRKELPKYMIFLISTIGILYVLFFAGKTITRNEVWKNDFTLFTTDVKTSATSAKSNCSAGGKLWEQAKTLTDSIQQKKYFNLSEKHLRKALEIYPNYADAWLLLGNVVFDGKKDIEEAALCYLKVIQWQLGHENAWNNLDIVLQKTENRNLQLKLYLQANTLNPSRYIINYRLGVLYGRYFGDLNNSIAYLSLATRIDSSKAEAFKDLGTAYGIAGNVKEAYYSFKKAVLLDGNDIQTYANLDYSCMQLGLTSEAKEYYKKVEQLEKNKQSNIK